MIKARNVLYFDYQDVILENIEFLCALRESILDGDVVVLRQVIPVSVVNKIKNYLITIGTHSLPNYQAILEGAKNYHRINMWDERAYVKGCFHQFSFFPWNQDVFNLFDITRKIFYLKNIINNQPKEKFLNAVPEDGCVARLSFQFYPKGIGGLHKHRDPVDHHQLTVPTLVMSKRGIDYQTGGVYVENQQGDLLYVEDSCEVGDVVLFNARIPHGVTLIDEHLDADWLSFEGRWMMIFATNKLSLNQNVSNAEDLEMSIQ